MGKKGDDPPPTVSCPICGSSFATIAALQAHLKTHEN